MRRERAVSVRFAASAALLLAMVATLGLALRMRGGSAEARQGGTADLQDMESAHAAAGVETSELGAVQNSFHEKVATLREEVRSNPDDAELALSLAHLLHDGHRPSEAIEYYEAAVELEPSDGQAYYDLALAYTEQGSWPEAANVLRRRLDLAPEDVVAMYDLGAVSANLGDRESARQLWAAVLSSNAPVEPDLRERTERALATLGGLDPP